MNGKGVAIRHREWLQALGYAERDSERGGPTGSELTEPGYELWAASEDGLITPNETEKERENSLQLLCRILLTSPSLNHLEKCQKRRLSLVESNKESQRAVTTEHERSLGRLRSVFEEHGFSCKKTRHSDLIAYKDGGQVFVFEVKSTSTGDL